MKTRIHWNTHKKCFSVKQGNNKIRHVDTFVLRNPVFVVSQKGRDRVLRERVKNVHAHVEGEPVPGGYSLAGLTASAVDYNPYTAGWFYEVYSGKKVLFGKYALFNAKSKVKLRVFS